MKEMAASAKIKRNNVKRNGETSQRRKINLASINNDSGENNEAMSKKYQHQRQHVANGSETSAYRNNQCRWLNENGGGENYQENVAAARQRRMQ